MITPRIPMVGKNFGRLTVVKQIENPKGKSREAWYECECECGGRIAVSGTSLRNGTTKSCGCLRTELTRQRNAEYVSQNFDLTGKRFQKLVVKKRLPERRTGSQLWLCECDCGNLHKVTTHHLLSGQVRSCGCLPKREPDDLTGQRFGKLSVVELTKKRKSNGGSVWKCRCDCGSELEVSAGNLKRGATISCGCVRREDLTGKRFGKLTVLRLGEKSNQGNGSFWVCKCDCGNVCEVQASKLKSGHTTSCGCAHRDSIKDLVGQRFGKLTVIRDSGKRRTGSGGVIWVCRCECGQEKEVRQDALLSGTTISCGCANSRGNAKISKLLKKANIVFVPEYSPPDMEGQYRFDFAVFDGATLSHLIEYDGILHFEYSGKGWNTKERFLRTKKSDKKKEEYCIKNNIPLIRIPYTRYQELCIEDLQIDTSEYL